MGIYMLNLTESVTESLPKGKNDTETTGIGGIFLANNISIAEKLNDDMNVNTVKTAKDKKENEKLDEEIKRLEMTSNINKNTKKIMIQNNNNMKVIGNKMAELSNSIQNKLEEQGLLIKKFRMIQI